MAGFATIIEDLGADDRPAQIFEVQFADAGLSNVTVVDLRVDAVVGGSGPAGDGAQLWLWDYDHWREVEGQNAASAATPAALSWTLSSDPGAASVSLGVGNPVAIGESQAVTFAVTSQSVGVGSSATVATDYIEGTVCYRHPLSP